MMQSETMKKIKKNNPYILFYYKTREQQSLLSYFMMKLETSDSYLLSYGLVGIEMNGVPPSPTTSGSLPSHACVFSHSR